MMMDKKLLSHALFRFIVSDDLSIKEKICKLEDHIQYCQNALVILSGSGIIYPDWLIACLKENMEDDDGKE